MKKSNIVITIAGVLALGGLAYGVMNLNNSEISSESEVQGDFQRLKSSTNPGIIGELELGDTMQEVTDTLGKKADKSQDISNTSDYDYYEHYELDTGEVYDIYYKDGKLVGATDFQ